MPMQIPFRNGRLDYSGAPAYNSRTVTIEDDVLDLAFVGAVGAILPASFASSNAIQFVPLTSIVLDFSQRLRDYNSDRLLRIIVGIQEGVDLPPLSVIARDDATYNLENGYHRFLACAILGFHSIPIDQAAFQPVAVAIPVARYIPRHLRK